MFGAPTIEEICNQPVFNPHNVEWLQTDSVLHLNEKYGHLPVSTFLLKLKLTGLDVSCWNKMTSVPQILASQMDNPYSGADQKIQKVLDWFEVQALN